MRVKLLVLIIISLSLTSACSEIRGEGKKFATGKILNAAEGDEKITSSQTSAIEVTQTLTPTPTQTPTHTPAPTQIVTVKKAEVFQTKKPTSNPMPNVKTSPVINKTATVKPVNRQITYSVIINKSTNKLYLYNNKVLINTYSVATGAQYGNTPEGDFTIVSKVRNPSWRDPKTNKVTVGGDPANPLGKYWLGLSVGGGSIYGIHGTVNEASIGTYATKGCIRMFNSEVEKFFQIVPVGTSVKIGHYSTIPIP